MSGKKIEVKCPNCNEKFYYFDSEYRPFCSEKCKNIDLGHWLSESYTVPAIELDDEEIEKLNEEVSDD